MTWLFWTSPTKYDGEGVDVAAVDGVASVRPSTIAAGSPPVSSIVRSSSNSKLGRWNLTLGTGRERKMWRCPRCAAWRLMMGLSQVDRQGIVLFRVEPIGTNGLPIANEFV